MKQKKVFITVGIPGSAKSTFIKKQIEKYGGIHISRDKIRFSMLKPEDEYFKIENKVFDVFIEQIQNAINNDKEDVYIDATHISHGSRKKLLNKLKFNNVGEIIWLYFDVPIEVALERNSYRKGRELVPESAILNMGKSLTKPNADDVFRVWTINKDGEVVKIE